MKEIKITRNLLIAALMASGAVGCAEKHNLNPTIPSLEYANKLKAQLSSAGAAQPVTYGIFSEQSHLNKGADSAKARMHFINDDKNAPSDVNGDFVSNENSKDFETYDSTQKNSRDYNGPLSLGDPGVTASLWRESRGSNDIFRDQRAWQPMDLITIVVSENSEGTKEADTEVKSESTVEAAISQLFGLDDALAEKAPTGEITPSSLVNASTTNEFKGEGETSRKGKLTAKISAMVAEVLPSGILRVEGQKIISVNNEEQVMVLSGLIRPRDIDSSNEVDSSKIANMRIDYFGNGIVGEAQVGGWLGRIMRYIWPF